MSELPVTNCEFSFGRFRLIPGQQLLLEGDEPVRLGARALELLCALVERPSELLGKDELVARIWPDTCVAQSNLKVQVAALRRALGEGRNGDRYVATANGHGYRFVGSVKRYRPSNMARETAPEHNLALGWRRPLGRDNVIDSLLRELPVRRLITIVGPGGIGKTTVALAIANTLLGQYRDGVWLVELAALRDPELVPSAIAAALGLRIVAKGGAKALPSLLRDKNMNLLIVLDCCEHLIDAVASVAEDVVRFAPEVHVIATSREPLRANGEAVQRLGPLASPAAAAALTATEAIRFPAVQLFVERAITAQKGFEIDDTNAKLVAEICRRLDGIALAIELAARRTDAFAVSELLSLLSDRFLLLTHGRRTDLPRHQTLAAAIDWSYDLLSEPDRTILRRLSVFVGAFDLKSAVAVVSDGEGLLSGTAACVGNLVAKSLVSAEACGQTFQYRLFDSMRVYLRQKLEQSGETAALSRRHAQHYCALLCRAEAKWDKRPSEEWLGEYGRSVDEVRAALDWAFSDNGDAELGAALTAVSVPLWIRLSHVDECRRHTERALDASWDRSRDDGRIEMQLSAALGSALLQTRGPASRARDTWRTAAEIAERIGDDGYHLQALWGLCDDHTWRGEHRAALRLAHRIREIAIRTNDRAAEVNVRRRIGTVLRYLGNFSEAREELEWMIGQDVDQAHWTHFAGFHLHPPIAARGTLANVLWLQGFPDQAISLSRQVLEKAKTTNHTLAVCNAFAYAAIPIALQVGDWPNAERWIAEFLDHTAKHVMAVWDAVGRCLKGILLTQQGKPEGLALLRSALDELAASGFRMRYPAYLGSLASGLCHFGRLPEARATLDEALDWSNLNEEHWCFGELLRIKGELLCADAAISEVNDAETCFQQSIEWSRRQSALSFELRAAASLARLWRVHDRSRHADQLLSATYGRFTEGFNTTDLRSTRKVLRPSPAVLA